MTNTPPIDPAQRGQKTNINPAILQQMLDSARNAAEKGQSQFFTPFDLAQTLCTALPRIRPTAVDLNCGAGALLQAAATKETFALFGNDIDPHRPKVEGVTSPRSIERITHDATLLYPLLKEVGFEADLFVLNPPWRLWWYRDRLADLLQSDLMSVRDAFAVVEETAPKCLDRTRKDSHGQQGPSGTIDSTIATLLMALDLSTDHGEGFLIANNNTLERLIFADNAPYAAVKQHIWAHLVIPGNPMAGIQDCQWQEGEQFCTGVIYFARSHTNGPRRYEWGRESSSPDRLYRQGAELRVESRAHDPREAWRAVAERISELNGRQPHTPYNLWLNAGGRIRTALSLFETRSTKVNKKEAERLHQLDGKAPMELVLQRAQRDELLHVCERGGWRVHPELVTAVKNAVREYHGARAPLYPLPEIQRLGYLDEQDAIECKADLAATFSSETNELENLDGTPTIVASLNIVKAAFTKGKKYSIRTQTVLVKRTVEKPNPFDGRKELLEFTGQELAIIIADAIIDPNDKKQQVNEFCFMDAKLKDDPNCEINIALRERSRGNGEKLEAGDAQKVHFTLQQLAQHFIIPEVPDVAAVNPERYNANVARLTALEALTTELTAA